MKKLSILFLLSIFLSGCATIRTVTINSEPTNATVYRYVPPTYMYGMKMYGDEWKYLGTTPLSIDVSFPNKNSYFEVKIEKPWYLTKYDRAFVDKPEINVQLAKEEEAFTEDEKKIFKEKGRPSRRYQYKATGGLVNIWYYTDEGEKVMFLDRRIHSTDKITDKDKVMLEAGWEPDDKDEYISGFHKIEKWWYRKGVHTETWGSASTMCFTFDNEVLTDVYKSSAY